MIKKKTGESERKTKLVEKILREIHETYIHLGVGRAKDVVHQILKEQIVRIDVDKELSFLEKIIDQFPFIRVLGEDEDLEMFNSIYKKLTPWGIK